MTVFRRNIERVQQAQRDFVKTLEARRLGPPTDTDIDAGSDAAVANVLEGYKGLARKPLTTEIRRGTGRPGEVFKSLYLSKIYELRGGDDSPVQLRTDAGIMLHQDTGLLIRRRDTFTTGVEVPVSPAAANTTAQSIFYLENDTGLDHYLTAISVVVPSATAANFDSCALQIETRDSAGSILYHDLFISDATNFITVGALNDRRLVNLLAGQAQQSLPLWVTKPANTASVPHVRYRFIVRSGAGGASEARAILFCNVEPTGDNQVHV